MSAVDYGNAVVGRIAALCEAEPEREVCGFVVLRSGALEVVPIENVADRYHARDPARFPRTSRESYLMDPRAQLRAIGFETLAMMPVMQIVPLLEDPIYFEIARSAIELQAYEFESEEAREILEQLDLED